jgi:hypothetical protein
MIQKGIFHGEGKVERQSELLATLPKVIEWYRGEVQTLSLRRFREALTLYTKVTCHLLKYTSCES